MRPAAQSSAHCPIFKELDDFTDPAKGHREKKISSAHEKSSRAH